VWPSLTGKAIVPAGSTVNYNAGATSCMHPVRGKNDIFQFGFANNIEVLNSEMGLRPVYYAPELIPRPPRSGGEARYYGLPYE
jgi:hypothetical protein